MWEGTVSYLLGEEGREALWSSQGSVGVKIEEATCSCLGLVLLAERSEEEVEKIYRGRPIPGFVEGHRELRRALSEIRIRSYAYGRGAGAGEGNALAVAFVDGKSALEVRGRFGEEECGGLSEVLRQVITTVERSWRSGD